MISYTRPLRIIGKYTGLQKGPLVILVGGMHGNEPAGVQAIEQTFEMLNEEPLYNPDFYFKGCLLGIRGNTRAISQHQRFIEKDFNRIWTKAHVDHIKASNILDLENEDLELREMITLLESEIARYQPSEIILLDLHTTTAYGGIFAVPSESEDSLKVAVALQVPVIKGLLNGIGGSLLHYFRKENIGVNTLCVAFESGQHDEPLSVHRAIAAIINCLRSVGCVQPEHVENRHDDLLKAYAKDLPKVAELITVHKVREEDHFQMIPGYQNFQKVKKGERLAVDKNGVIWAPEEALVLMPLYQPQGEDGFFLIREVK
jgi:succinylglutamate desuccinylase